MNRMASLLCLLLLLPALPAEAAGRHKDKAPVSLSIDAPRSGGRHGLNSSTGWSLTLRARMEAIAFIESGEGSGGRREAAVLEDPDGCLDARNFPINPPATPYEDCDGPDELLMEFTTERIDSFDIESDNTGNFLLRAQLVDDAFVPGVLLNKPYLRNTQGDILPISRPQTGDQLLDGYGYGVDDNWPGLVIMADIGGARVFTPEFDLVPGVIRNLAGFTNTVSAEFLDRRGRSAVTASLHVLAGVFEPIVIFDLAVDDPDVDFLRRLESGPVEAFRFDTPPANDDELLVELVSTYSPVDFTLRAVIVEGTAPEFIQDMNGDGRYTDRDVERMGYRLLSNQASIRLIEEFDLVNTQTPRGRTCPPPTHLYGDLDANGLDGAIACSGTGGARRARRVPR